MCIHRNNIGQPFYLYRLIEEFMLLANMTVANVISVAFPESAMLRRHPKPNERAAALLVCKLILCYTILDP